jgi:putative tryptophan/tyrosine transport system substrate-binding protein
MEWRLIHGLDKGARMNKRRDLIIALGASALVGPLDSFAQQQRKLWRVGVLDTTSTNAVYSEAFRKGLHELGYVEGENLVIEYRSADGRLEQLAELAIELVHAKVDVIVPRGTNASLAAKNATTTIPIVLAAVGDPVESGLVKSLSHPGGNVTGLSSVSANLTAKRVELIKETVPGVKRIGCLTNPDNPDSSISLKQIEREGQSRGVQLQVLEVRKPEDLASSFDVARKQGVGAIVVVGNTLLQPNRELIVALAAKHRLPTIYPAREFVDAGGLMSYTIDYAQLYYHAANFVDKIFKGAKPADLPIEQPTKFELVINLNTAKVLGLTIPRAVLARADDLIQ